MFDVSGISCPWSSNCLIWFDSLTFFFLSFSFTPVRFRILTFHGNIIRWPPILWNYFTPNTVSWTVEFRLFALDTRRGYLFADRVVLHSDEFSIQTCVKYFTVNIRAIGKMKMYTTVINHVHEVLDKRANRGMYRF